MARNIPPAWGLGEEVIYPQNKINILDAELSGSMIVHRVFLTIWNLWSTKLKENQKHILMKKFS